MLQGGTYVIMLVSLIAVRKLNISLILLKRKLWPSPCSKGLFFSYTTLTESMIPALFPVVKLHWGPVLRPEYLMLSLAAQSYLTLCNPVDCSPPGSSVHGDSLGKNTGEDCYALLHGIFPTQGWNPGLLHCRWTLYHLSHQGRLNTWWPVSEARASLGWEA